MGLPVENLAIEDFIAWENAQETKNEFYRGEVFAMTGGRRVHGLVVGNLFAALKQHVKGTPCRTFSESMKIQLGRDAIFCADVFVTCDKTDLVTDMIFRHPTVVVEVLSPSTQAFDRSVKFAAYRQITELREYLLVDPDTRQVEVFRRNAAGNFELFDQTGTAELVLDSIGLRLAMAEVFDGIEASA